MEVQPNDVRDRNMHPGTKIYIALSDGQALYRLGQDLLSAELGICYGYILQCRAT